MDGSIGIGANLTTHARRDMANLEKIWSPF